MYSCVSFLWRCCLLRSIVALLFLVSQLIDNLWVNILIRIERDFMTVDCIEQIILISIVKIVRLLINIIFLFVLGFMQTQIYQNVMEYLVVSLFLHHGPPKTARSATIQRAHQK